MDAIVTKPPGDNVVIDARGKLYRFLALCFAHPDETTLAWWKGSTAIEEVLDILTDLDADGKLVSRVAPSLQEFVKDVGALSFDEFESTYIQTFVCSIPQVLCPPYSSLYTSVDDDRRLADMSAVKDFYASCGMQLTEDYNDLPDHVSVEFEFLQYLAYEETQARAQGDDQLVDFFAGNALEFIDRHVIGLMDGMAAVAATIEPPNVFCRIIDIAAEILRYDRACRLAVATDNSSLQKGQDR